jgi:hypothetical protein
MPPTLRNGHSRHSVACGLGELGHRSAVVVDCKLHGRPYMAAFFHTPKINASSHCLPEYSLNVSYVLINRRMANFQNKGGNTPDFLSTSQSTVRICYNNIFFAS